MDKIIQYYGLDKAGYNQSNVDFINLRLDKDNRIFLDYNKIIKFTTPLAPSMRNNIDKFLGALFKLTLSKKATEIHNLLNGLHECNFTKLGMSRAKPAGNSVGNVLKDLIQENAEYVIAALRTGQFSPDVLYFGVDQIGPDRNSDIIVSIIKPLLIQFTQEQCHKHGIPLKTTDVKNMFDPSTATWKTNRTELPFYDGSPVIFIPKTFGSSEGGLGSTFDKFLRFGFHAFVKKNPEYAFLLRPGNKDDTVMKKDYDKYKSEKGVKSKDEVKKWIKNNPTALDDFHDKISPDISEMTTDEIEDVIGK